MKFSKATAFVVIALAATTMMNCSGQRKVSYKRIHFDYDQSYVRRDMVPVLDENVKTLKRSGRSITVEGHCDERGTNEYNYALGARRAQATKNYLVSHGAKASRIKTVSYGEDRPLKRGYNEAAWYQNRRAEFVKASK